MPTANPKGESHCFPAYIHFRNSDILCIFARMIGLLCLLNCTAFQQKKAISFLVSFFRKNLLTEQKKTKKVMKFSGERFQS